LVERNNEMIRAGRKKRIEAREILLEKLQEVLRAEPRVKFAYAFGSVVAGSAGPPSDL
jgi:predicted nucleotidyltransferase